MSIWDKLLPAPVGASQQGIITPQDVANSRRQALLMGGAAALASPGNAFPALGEGVMAGLKGYQNALGNAAQMRIDQTAYDQRQRVQDRRDAIAAKFIAQPGETRDQAITRLRAMMADYINAGDVESVRSLAGYLASADPSRRAPNEPIKTAVDENGNPYFARVDEEGNASTVMGPDGKPLQAYERPYTPPGQITPQNVVQNRLAYRSQWRQDMGEYQKLAEAAHLIKLASGPNSNGISDMQLIEAFQKVVNPGGVVRTQTMQMLQQSASAMDKIAAAIGQATTGGKLGPDQRAAIIRMGNKIATTQREAVEKRKTSLLKEAAAGGVDQLELDNPFDLTDSGGESAPGAPNADEILDRILKARK